MEGMLAQIVAEKLDRPSLRIDRYSFASIYQCIHPSPHQTLLEIIPDLFNIESRVSEFISLL